MSTVDYTRMKRGNLRGVSESVLRSLARTLRMDEAETQHLFDLARAASDGTRARRAKPQPTRLPQRATHPATELNLRASSSEGRSARPVPGQPLCHRAPPPDAECGIDRRESP
ncbi:hypothetical protein [Streptomyces cinerochromogenes]|uniref:hypothetical protein n=1 Tax=Streptomyces cinerochromogenes TaxID=66422 RepID=UPI0033BAAE37